MRKTKILVAFVLLAALVVWAGYRYLYHAHRDIATEDADFALRVAQLEQKFLKNPTNANAVYPNKVIEVAGAVTDFDAQTRVAVLDGKLSAMLDSTSSVPKTGMPVTIKGRFLGYDDLLGELRMDQASIKH